jgi:hypothetical protein
VTIAISCVQERNKILNSILTSLQDYFVVYGLRDFICVLKTGIVFEKSSIFFKFSTSIFVSHIASGFWYSAKSSLQILQGNYIHL